MIFSTTLSNDSVAEARSEAGRPGEALGRIRAPQDHRSSGKQESGSQYADR